MNPVCLVCVSRRHPAVRVGRTKSKSAPSARMAGSVAAVKMRRWFGCMMGRRKFSSPFIKPRIKPKMGRRDCRCCGSLRMLRLRQLRVPLLRQARIARRQEPMLSRTWRVLAIWRGRLAIGLGNAAANAGSRVLALCRAQISRPRISSTKLCLGAAGCRRGLKGGKFCGSRGMALPLLGLRARLRGAAADAYCLSYSATFVDGTAKGPVEGGESCEAESLAPLEAFQVALQRKEGAAQPAPLTHKPDEAAEGSKAPPSLRTVSRPTKPATPVRRRS